MQYIIKPRAARKIYTFYGNVTKKYRHTYDKEDYKRNVRDALSSIYDIECKLLRRQPTIGRWKDYYMAIPTSGITPIPSMARPSRSWMPATRKICMK